MATKKHRETTQKSSRATSVERTFDRCVHVRSPHANHGITTYQSKHNQRRKEERNKYKDKDQDNAPAKIHFTLK